MARYQLNLAYDGTEFLGFQRQGTKVTVQFTIEKALKELGWHGRSIISAGRTDTGVHAAGQVAAFDLEWKHSTKELQNALNAKLPDSISVNRVIEAKDDFHPRFDALARLYRYSIFHQDARNPLKERYAWRIEKPVSFEALGQTAKILIGTHDFGEFGRAMKKGNPTERTVYFAKWTHRAEGDLEFEVVANAFLYHMVRRMVYLQILVAQGRLSLRSFEDAILLKKTTTPGMAPANGLCLERVLYKSERHKDWKIDQVLSRNQYPSN